jgi:hypothetical protein
MSEDDPRGATQSGRSHLSARVDPTARDQKWDLKIVLQYTYTTVMLCAYVSSSPCPKPPEAT